MALYHRLRRVIGATVRLLSRAHSFLSKGKPTQLSVLRQRGPYEYGAVCDMVCRIVSPPGTIHHSFIPGALVAAIAVMRAVANVAAVLAAAGERGAGLNARHLASDDTVPDNHTGQGDGIAEREKNVAAGRVHVALQGSDQGGEPTNNTDTDDEQESGVDHNAGGDHNSNDSSETTRPMVVAPRPKVVTLLAAATTTTLVTEAVASRRVTITTQRTLVLATPVALLLQ